MSEFIHHLIDTMGYEEYDYEDALLDWDEYDEMKEQQSQ